MRLYIMNIEYFTTLNDNWIIHNDARSYNDDFFFQMNLNPYILSFGKFKLTNLVNVLSVLIFHVSIHSVRGKWKFDDLTEKFVKLSKRDSFLNWLLSSSTFIAYLLVWFYWSAKNYSSNGEIELFCNLIATFVFESSK